MSSQTTLTARLRQLEAESRELRETCASDRAAHEKLVANVIARHGILEAGVEFLAKPCGLTGLGRKLRDILSAQ
jgi:hypothetical protein